MPGAMPTSVRKADDPGQSGLNATMLMGETFSTTRCVCLISTRKRHQSGCGPKCDYEPAERDRVTIDETLTKSKSGMSGTCNRETRACSVIQARQYDGIGE